eukprot:1154174-Pelagomonas_calceolata.AAC.8
MTPAGVPTTPAKSWACQACTYVHSGREAMFIRCAICNALNIFCKTNQHVAVSRMELSTKHEAPEVTWEGKGRVTYIEVT